MEPQYISDLNPDYKYLVPVDPSIEVCHTPIDDGSCQSCVNCMYAEHVYINEKLVDDFSDRVLKISNTAAFKIKQNIQNCTFKKLVCKCKFYPDNVRHTLESACIQYEEKEDFVHPLADIDVTHEVHIQNVINSAKKIGI